MWSASLPIVICRRVGSGCRRRWHCDCTCHMVPMSHFAAESLGQQHRHELATGTSHQHHAYQAPTGPAPCVLAPWSTSSGPSSGTHDVVGTCNVIVAARAPLVHGIKYCLSLGTFLATGARVGFGQAGAFCSGGRTRHLLVLQSSGFAAHGFDYLV
jgi:hypothetical protein